MQHTCSSGYLDFDETQARNSAKLTKQYNDRGLVCESSEDILSKEAKIDITTPLSFDDDSPANPANTEFGTEVDTGRPRLPLTSHFAFEVPTKSKKVAGRHFENTQIAITRANLPIRTRTRDFA